MRLPVTDVRFVPRLESRARRQGTSDEFAVLRAEASTNSRREPVPERQRSDDDLAVRMRESDRHRARVWSESAPPTSASQDSSAAALEALRRESARRPAFVVAMASAFLRPSITERLLNI